MEEGLSGVAEGASGLGFGGQRGGGGGEDSSIKLATLLKEFRGAGQVDATQVEAWKDSGKVFEELPVIFKKKFWFIF